MHKRFIYHFKAACKKHQNNILQLPLILSWYKRVLEVPGIKQATVKCNIKNILDCRLHPLPNECQQNTFTAFKEPENVPEEIEFIGGPRPTITKLMVGNYFIRLDLLTIKIFPCVLRTYQ